ncbi:hypothetical protein D3C81_2146480 [compost metagenome]
MIPKIALFLHAPPSASNNAALGPSFILKMNLLSGCSISGNVLNGANVTGFGTSACPKLATPVLMVTAWLTPLSPILLTASS